MVAALRSEIIGVAVLHQVAAKHNRVHEAVGVALEVAAALDTSDALEPKGVPNLARGDVGLVDEVEHGVCVAELGGPFEVGLAHQATDTAVTGGVCDEKAGVANVTAAAGVVGLDVEAAETFLAPVATLDNLVGVFDAAEKHDGAKVLEPVVGKLLKRHGINHRVGVTTLDFLAELIAEVEQQRWGYLGARGKGHNGRDGLAITERNLAGHDGGRQRGVGRVGKRAGAGDAVDGGSIRVIHDGGHGETGGRRSRRNSRKLEAGS